MSAETETGSDGATTPTNGSTTKTSPAAAYRKTTNGHDLEGSCAALEEAMSACAGHISSDASRTTLAKARDALSKLFGAQAKLTAQIDSSQKPPSEKKALLDRCEKLEQAIERASIRLKDAVKGACCKRRDAADEAYSADQFDAAYAAYTAALGFAPDDVSSLLGKARSASQLKDWQACITDARKAARLDVQSSEAHQLLVNALLETNDPQQAAQALGNAPDDVLETSDELQALGNDRIPEAAKKAANTLFQQKKFQEALALYTLAVELTDGQRHVYLSNRSACLQALGRWERAADDARRVIELKPDFAKGHLHLARSLVRLDRKLEACEVLEEGIEDGAISASRRVEAPSRHLHESSPGEQVVGGLFFDFGAVRTASSEYDAPRRSRGRVCVGETAEGVTVREAACRASQTAVSPITRRRDVRVQARIVQGGTSPVHEVLGH
jgi:tetratricopeptide (TPR) repeat protein